MLFRSDKWEFEQIDYFDKQRLDILFYLAIDQSEKVRDFVDVNQLKSKDQLPNNFDYKSGIPLHWKIIKLN